MRPSRSGRKRADPPEADSTQGAPRVPALEDLRTFQLAVEQSFGLVVITDAQGIIEYVNPRFAEATGYSREEVLGQHVSMLRSLPDEESEKLWDTVRAGKTWRGEFQGRRKGGEGYWLLSSVSPVRAEGGTITHFLGVNLDITERQRTEEALRDSEAQHRALLDSYPDGVAVLIDGKLVYANPALCELSGYPTEETMGKAPDDFLVPADRQPAGEHIEALLKGAPPLASTYQIVRRDGATVPVEVISKVISYRQGPALLSVLRDIRPRVEAERALRESEAKFRTLAEASPMAAFIVTDGRLLYVNEASAALYGYTRDELLEMNAWEMVDPAFHPELQKQAEEYERGERHHVRIEMKTYTKSGEERWVDFAAGFAQLDGRRVAIGMSIDITDRKGMETALQARREELEEKAERRVEQGGGYALTFRELTVLELIAAGKSDKEIGAILGISHHTANKHVAKILRRMHAASRTEAGVRALREGLAG